MQPPQPGDGLGVDQLEDALLPVGPLDVARAGVLVLEELEQELPQVGGGALAALPLERRAVRADLGLPLDAAAAVDGPGGGPGGGEVLALHLEAGGGPAAAGGGGGGGARGGLRGGGGRGGRCRGGGEGGRGELWRLVVVGRGGVVAVVGGRGGGGRGGGGRVRAVAAAGGGVGEHGVEVLWKKREENQIIKPADFPQFRASATVTSSQIFLRIPPFPQQKGPRKTNFGGIVCGE